MRRRLGQYPTCYSALKRLIRAAGDALVQDYVDDGYSGAQLNRPALDQLRSDLKTAHFDTIYFLNTDRIARDVTYQNIIISEILKHRKQITLPGYKAVKRTWDQGLKTSSSAPCRLSSSSEPDRDM